MKPTEAVAELNRAATGLSTMARDIADGGSTAARQAILDTVTSRRGTLSMSGLGATLDVETALVSSTDSTAQASLRATPANAWAIVDKGAAPHMQRRERGVFGGGGMPAAPYGVFSRIEHPGVTGLAVAAPARAAADDAVAETAQTALQALPRHA